MALFGRQPDIAKVVDELLEEADDYLLETRILSKHIPPPLPLLVDQGPFVYFVLHCKDETERNLAQTVVQSKADKLFLGRKRKDKKLDHSVITVPFEGDGNRHLAVIVILAEIDTNNLGDTFDKMDFSFGKKFKEGKPHTYVNISTTDMAKEVNESLLGKVFGESTLPKELKEVFELMKKHQSEGGDTKVKIIPVPKGMQMDKFDSFFSSKGKDPKKYLQEDLAPKEGDSIEMQASKAISRGALRTCILDEEDVEKRLIYGVDVIVHPSESHAMEFSQKMKEELIKADSRSARARGISVREVTKDVPRLTTRMGEKTGIIFWNPASSETHDKDEDDMFFLLREEMSKVEAK
jgi:hypothetical protein